MLNLLRPAIVTTLGFTLLTGIVYPLAITGLAQVVAPAQASGSLISRNGTIVGSALIGQAFSSERYFWPRPSVAGDGYDAAASGGSSLGTTSAKLVERVKDEIERLHGVGVEVVPADAATASGSGLDPHISPAFAQAQVARVAQSRNLGASDVAALVLRFTDERLLGIVGEPRVNVLELNLALDDLQNGE